MLAKDLFKLKPGTFIKGLCVGHADGTAHLGRRARLSVDGWKIEGDPTLNAVQTPFYKGTVNELFSGETGLRYLSELELGAEWMHQSKENPQLTMHWLKYSHDDAIGIHLGEFFWKIEDPTIGLWPDVLVFSKILRTNGEVGYIGLATSAVHGNELELL